MVNICGSAEEGGRHKWNADFVARSFIIVRMDIPLQPMQQMKRFLKKLRKKTVSLSL